MPPRHCRRRRPHGETLILLLEPAGAVGDADRERSSGDADEESGHQQLPVLGGISDQVDGITVTIMMTKNTGRPPNLSVIMPRGRRIREPVGPASPPGCQIGSHSIQVAALIGIPITANIIHHEARKRQRAPRIRTDICLVFWLAIAVPKYLRTTSSGARKSNGSKVYAHSSMVGAQRGIGGGALGETN